MKWICLTYLLVVSCNAFSQENTDLQSKNDSLIKILSAKKDDSTQARTYRNLFLLNRYESPEIALKYIKKSQEIIEKMDWERGMALIYKDIGNHYSDTGDHTLAIEYYLKSEKYISLVPTDKVLLYNSLSLVYLKESKIKKAEEYITLASKEINKDVNPQFEGAVFETKAEIALFKKDTIDTKKNLLIALEKFNSSPDKKANALTKLGDVENDYNKKMKFYLQSRKIYDSITPTSILSVSNMLTLAEVNNALLDNKSLKKKYNISVTDNQLIQESEKYLYKSISYSKLANALQNEMYAYGLMAATKGHKKEFDSAYYYLGKNLELYDNIFSQENKNKIAKLESQKEIELRDKELQLNKLTLQAKEKQKWFYIAGILLLGIIGALLFFQSRNRSKTNRKLQLLNIELDQANKVKTRFFSILNHDLRSPVANLIHFLHLQKDSPELMDEATKNRMQSKTISGAENLLSSMEDILLWSKGQMENFKPEPKKVSVNQLFEDNKKVFSGYQNITFDYQNPDSIELFTDENYLKTIVRNLTSNALNVFTTTPQPTIIWKAWQADGTSYLSITDNGPGASQEQFKALYDDKEVVGIKSGLGLHLIRDLAKAIHCHIKVDSQPNLGTTFTLIFTQ